MRRFGAVVGRVLDDEVALRVSEDRETEKRGELSDLPQLGDLLCITADGSLENMRRGVCLEEESLGNREGDALLRRIGEDFARKGPQRSRRG